MALESQWATLEDFATLFQYLWHKDFPLGPESATGAKRADWTIHIGIVVRSLANLMGLIPRFETGNRTDAVLRSSVGNEIAVEWEWDGVKGNELKKLRNHNAWSPPGKGKRQLKYAVLITYVETSELENAYNHVARQWVGSDYPLLLIVIETKKSSKFYSGWIFKHIHMSSLDSQGRTDLRLAPAVPWDTAPSARWFRQSLDMPNL